MAAQSLHEAFHRWLLRQAQPTLHEARSHLRHGAQAGEEQGAIILPFLLHGLSWEAGDALLRKAGRQAPYLILMDYRLPERNLDFPAHWLICALEGGLFPKASHRGQQASHGTAWRQFMRQGGLEALVQAACARSGVPPLYRSPLCGGAASLVLMASPGL